MVEVFKTDIDQKIKADEIVNILSVHFPSYKINVDFEDCDRVLRIESDILDVDEVVSILRGRGVEIEAL
jgi:Neuraminidase (sialidase)